MSIRWLLVFGGHISALRELAELIRRTIEGGDFLFEGTRIPITVSLGIALWLPDSSETLTALLKRAGESVLEAKRAGRNCVM